MNQEPTVVTGPNKTKKVNGDGLGAAVKKALENSGLEGDINQQSIDDEKQKEFYSYLKGLKKDLNKASFEAYKKKEMVIDRTMTELREQIAEIEEQNGVDDTLDKKKEDLKEKLAKTIEEKIKILNEDIDFLMTAMPNTNPDELDDFGEFYDYLIKNPEAPELLEILRSPYGTYTTGKYKKTIGGKEEEMKTDKYELIDEKYKELYNSWKANKQTNK